MKNETEERVEEKETLEQLTDLDGADEATTEEVNLEEVSADEEDSNEQASEGDEDPDGEESELERAKRFAKGCPRMMPVIGATLALALSAMILAFIAQWLLPKFGIELPSGKNQLVAANEEAAQVLEHVNKTVLSPKVVADSGMTKVSLSLLDDFMDSGFDDGTQFLLWRDENGKVNLMHCRTVVIDMQHEVYGKSYKWSASGMDTIDIPYSDIEDGSIFYAEGVDYDDDVEVYSVQFSGTGEQRHVIKRFYKILIKNYDGDKEKAKEIAEDKTMGCAIYGDTKLNVESLSGDLLVMEAADMYNYDSSLDACEVCGSKDCRCAENECNCCSKKD